MRSKSTPVEVSRAVRCLWLAFAIVTVLLVSRPARAGEPNLVWKERWPRFATWEYALTGASIAGVGALMLKGHPEHGAQREAGIDTAARTLLRAESRAGRDRARLIGDTTFRGLFLYPYLVDTVAAAWLANESPDVAGQMFLIDTQAFALSGVVSLMAERFVGRARPSSAECKKDPGYERFCDGSDENSSFFSGHTATAATGAGLVCVHHENLPLYGGGIADRLACPLAVTGAIAAGWARIANDRHYASDVLIGGGIGALAGYVMPHFVHYAPGSMGRSGSTSLRWSLMVAPAHGGASVSWVAVQ